MMDHGHIVGLIVGSAFTGWVFHWLLGADTIKSKYSNIAAFRAGYEHPRYKRNTPMTDEDVYAAIKDAATK
jgi:hypothetical protein